MKLLLLLTATLSAQELRFAELKDLRFRIRFDTDGEYYHLITAWKATAQEEQSYAENV